MHHCLRRLPRTGPKKRNGETDVTEGWDLILSENSLPHRTCKDIPTSQSQDQLNYRDWVGENASPFGQLWATYFDLNLLIFKIRSRDHDNLSF